MKRSKRGEQCNYIWITSQSLFLILRSLLHFLSTSAEILSLLPFFFSLRTYGAFSKLDSRSSFLYSTSRATVCLHSSESALLAERTVTLQICIPTLNFNSTMNDAFVTVLQVKYNAYCPSIFGMSRFMTKVRSFAVSLPFIVSVSTVGRSANAHTYTLTSLTSH